MYATGTTRKLRWLHTLIFEIIVLFIFQVENDYWVLGTDYTSYAIVWDCFGSDDQSLRKLKCESQIDVKN